MPALSRPLSRWAAIAATLVLVAVMPATASATDPVNDPPIAVDDPGSVCGPQGLPGQPPPFGGAYPLPEDYFGGFGPTDYFTLLCGPLENDSDPNGDPLTWEIATPTSHGDIVKFDETAFGYRPLPNFSTKPGDVAGGTWDSDSFTYRAFDGQAYSNVATWRYWVMPVNDPPTYSPGEDVWVLEDSGSYRAVWATNISPGPANESDQAVQFTLEPVIQGQTFGPGPLFAELPAIDGSGVLTFALTPGVNGYAHVTFRVKDDGGMTDYTQGTQAPRPDDTADDASFTIFVLSNEVVAEDDVIEIAEDPTPNPVPVSVLGNDTYPSGSWISHVTQGQRGTVSIAPDGQSLFYAPNPNANGSDSFTYMVDSGSGSGFSDSATVSVTIHPVNDAPVAQPDAVSVVRNALATDVPVLANDTDIDGDGLTVVSATNGSLGTVVVSLDGTHLTYQPARNVVGTDSFTYRVSDGHGGTATTTVQITIVKPKGPKG